MKKLTPLAVLLSVSCLYASAQDDAGGKKLKEVQAASVFAPAKVKIDGNLSEWNNGFEAYNKSTKLYYTMSNDDKYLYLAVKSTDATNNTKIIAGGITLAINTANKKKDKDAYSITFPSVAPPTRGQRGAGGFGGGGARVGGGLGGFNRGDRSAPDSASIAQAHAQTIAQSKEIKVLGFKDITDSTISIYNEYGIKTAIGYDKEGNYVYETAIPLKLMDLSIDNPKEFSYNIKVNGRQLPNFNRDGANGGPGGQGGFGGGAPGGGGFGGGGGRGGRGGGGAGGFGGGAPGGARINGGGARGPGGIDFAELTTPSDFWGKYTLAKK